MDILSSPLLKIPLMLSNVYCSVVVSRDPNPKTTAEEQQKYKVDETAQDTFWSMNGWLFNVRKTAIYSLVVFELYATLSHFYPLLRIASLSHLVPALSSPLISNVTITPTFLTASLLIHFGALIRWSCYHALGTLFTFNLSIRPKHKLITSGPYAYVRHPAYTGSLVFFVGLGQALLGRGSWFRECVLESGEGVGWRTKLLAVDIVVYLMWTAWILVRRTGREDRALKEHFGQDWEAWAVRTRYRLVPYVY